MTYTITHSPTQGSMTARCDTCGTQRAGTRTAVTAWQRAHSCRDELLSRARASTPAQPRTAPDPATGPAPRRRPIVPIHFRGADR